MRNVASPRGGTPPETGDGPPPAVAEVFASYPPASRAKLMELRRLILDGAEATPGVGGLEETIRWGDPSYLTTESGSGTTIRIGATKSNSR